MADQSIPKLRKFGPYSRGLVTGLMVGVAFNALAIYDISERMYSSLLGGSIPETATAAEEASIMVSNALQLADMTLNKEIKKEDIPKIIDGTLRSLDEYSGFMDKAYTDQISKDRTADDGPRLIGIMGDSRPEGYFVNSTMPGSPADKAGLRKGDRLIGVDEVDVSGLSGTEAHKALLDRVSDASRALVNVKIKRDDKSFAIDIEPTNLPPVLAYEAGVKNGFVHVRLGAFFPGLYEDLHNVLKKYRSQSDIKGVVLDLRGNSGGLTTETQKIASLFFQPGDILYQEQGLKVRSNVVVVDTKPEFGHWKLGVLIDEHSASASEIFASATQANNRGIVAGVTSFGKGTVQHVYPLLDGSGAIKITVAEYKDAAGRTINKVGVRPDLEIKELTERVHEKDPAFEALIEALGD